MTQQVSPAALNRIVRALIGTSRKQRGRPRVKDFESVDVKRALFVLEVLSIFKTWNQRDAIQFLEGLGRIIAPSEGRGMSQVQRLAAARANLGEISEVAALFPPERASTETSVSRGMSRLRRLAARKTFD